MGIVEKQKHAGYYYALASLGYGIGYDFEPLTDKPFVLFTKFNLITMFSYNSTVYMRPNIEVTIAYKIKNAFQIKVKNYKNRK